MKKLNELIERVGMDRVAHFFGVLMVAFIVAAVFAKVDKGYCPAVYGVEGAIGGLLVAIAKEAVDFCSPNGSGKFDGGDLLAGAIGCAVSFGLAVMLL